MPVFLTEIQNQRLIGKATVEKVRERTIIGQKKIEKISVIERLKTIIRAETESTGIVTEQMKMELNSLDFTQIVNALNDQIQIMQEVKALPLFEIEKDYSLQYFSRRTLMDSKDPTTFVSLWDISLMYENYTISAYIDTETDVVYQIRISARVDEFQMDISQLKFTNFLTYLGVDPSQVDWTVGENKWELNYYEEKEKETDVNYFCYLEKGYVDYSILFQ